MIAAKSVLDHVYDHEKNLADFTFMTQPMGNGRVQDYTWAQTVDEARRMAAHLRAQGYESGFRAAILSKNCAQFIIAELAIWMAGGCTVAIFPTEAADTVRYVLDHSGASVLFVGKLDTWSEQEVAVRTDLPCIAFSLAPESARRRFPTWEAVVEATAPLGGTVQRNPDDLAMLLYTSGSTGTPKGCMHRFGAVSVVGEAIVRNQDEELGADFEYRALSYLPLSHVFERTWVEVANLVAGRSHLYFAEALDTFLADLQRARPTVFISVPRLWLKFQQGVFAKVPPKRLDFLLRLPFIGRLVGRKVLAGLGLNEVKRAASGSAPISKELVAWYRRLGLQLIEGYGMSEDLAYSHTMNPQKNTVGTVGVALAGVQSRLSADGEIEIKSPGTFAGYYRQPELTAEVFTPDGFFKTGDLGEYTADGQLRITGRKKELFKTAKGKYVAPAPIENLLLAHPSVEQAMVSGSGQSAPYALVVPAEDLRPKLGDAAVKAKFEADMAALLQSVNAQLPDYEKLRMIVATRRPWTIENGCLTPTMKIKRAKIENVSESRLEGWYQQKGPVVWD